MRNLTPVFLSALFLSLLSPTASHAQSAAPEMFDVKEVVIDYARFDDPKASDTCGLSREQVAETLARNLKGTDVPAVPVADVHPPIMGVARIQLIPKISTHTDENFDCISWVELSAENRVNAVIPPVPTLRNVKVIYWQQHTKVGTNQTLHEQKIDLVLEKMIKQFAQQYRIDQPPTLPKIVK